MENVIGIIKNAKLKLLCAQKDPSVIQKVIRDYGKDLKILNNLLKSVTKSSQRSQISNGLCLLTSYRSQLKLLRGGVSNKTFKRSKTPSYKVKWDCFQSSFKSRMQTIALTNLKHMDPIEFLKDCKKIFVRKIKTQWKIENILKVNEVLCGEFKIQKPDEEIFELKYMNTKNHVIYEDTNLNYWFAKHINDIILKDLEDFQEKESGWSLSAIINLTLNINKYTPQLGSSYIKLPEQLERKEACINVQNTDDNACFAWAVISAIFPVEKDPQRLSKYPHYSEKLNLKGIQFPMTLNQIPRFEKQNNLSINVYRCSKVSKSDHLDVVSAYLLKIKQMKHINLLLIQDVYYTENESNESNGENDLNYKPIKYHYVWIKDLSRLISSQLGLKHGKKHICDRCLHYFYSNDKLQKHLENCENQNFCKIKLPTEAQKMLKFKNYRNKIMNPFIIYADLECILKKTNKLCEYQEHVPCSIGYYVRCSYNSILSYYKANRGENCVSWFTNEIKCIAEYLDNIIENPLELKLTEAENMKFYSATICHICNKTFNNDENIKVRDHCHLTGSFRGAAHNGCNINYKDDFTVPVVFHNLSGYDSHFIIKNIATDIAGRVNLLPINKERYISFTKQLTNLKTQFRFIDSYRFMGASLDKLSSFLTTFPILKSEFNMLSNRKFDLLTTKGVYPYDYFDCINKFMEESLPPIEQFNNKLNECVISQQQYERA